MIIFLYGEDSFRRKRKYAEIVSEFIAKNGNLGFSEFNSDETNKFLETVKNRSIFSPRTLVGLKDAELERLPKDTLESLKGVLSRIADSQEIIALLSSVDRELPKDMGYLTASSTKIQEFTNLSKEKLAFFVEKEAAAKGIKLSELDIKAFISSFSGDLWAIESELDKLSLARTQEWETPSITRLGYFELLNTLKFGKIREKKLIALEVILYKLKEDPARVFNSLAYSSPRGTLPELWFGIMADYDVAIKSGRMDYESALLDFAIR